MRVTFPNFTIVKETKVPPALTEAQEEAMRVELERINAEWSRCVFSEAYGVRSTAGKRYACDRDDWFSPIKMGGT